MKFIPYGRQDIDDNDIAAVIEVLRSDYLTQGPAISDFENDFRSYIGSSFAIAVSNGTAGLHLAYLAAGAGPGDAIFVPAITFAATANAALYCGATPVFVDIDPETQCMSLSSLEEAISLASKNRLNPKIISLVYYAGRPVEDLQRFGSIATGHGMSIVEDACHALGAEYRTQEIEEYRKIGNSTIAAMTVFSFHPVKHITTGEGGMVTTNQPELAARLQMLRTHGITKEASLYQNRELSLDEKTGMPNLWYHEMQQLGFNYRITDIQAVLGRSQLKRLPTFIEKRREIASNYKMLFAGNGKIRTPYGDSALVKHGYHLYPIQIDFSKISLSKNQVMTKLKERGVGTQVHYIPVCWHPFYRNNAHLWLSVSISESASFYEKTVSIPMFSSLRESEYMWVSSMINEVVC